MPGIDGLLQRLSGSHVAWAFVSAIQRSIALFLGACIPRNSIQKRTGALEPASLFSGALAATRSCVPASGGRGRSPLQNDAGGRAAPCRGHHRRDLTGSEMLTLSAFAEALNPEETAL